MPFGVSVLGSGSSGNCSYVVTDSTRVLIDAGFSARSTERRLGEMDAELDGLDAIIVSHEHGDHVKGVGSIQKHLSGVPVYATPMTAAAAGLETEVETFQSGKRFRVGDIDVFPFTVPHDAIDPVGFIVEHGGARAAIVTDLGYITDSIVEHLKGVDVLVIESNHDVAFLRHSLYPEFVKQRISGRLGHLSNDQAAEFFRERHDGKARHIVLAHLSRGNNDPEIAVRSAVRALNGSKNFPGSLDGVVAAGQNEATSMVFAGEPLTLEGRVA